MATDKVSKAAQLIDALTSRNAQKMVGLLVGSFLGWLGYRLFIKGVTGEFDFATGMSGFTAKLVSGSPGLFFALLGATIVIVSLRQRRRSVRRGLAGDDDGNLEVIEEEEEEEEEE